MDELIEYPGFGIDVELLRIENAGIVAENIEGSMIALVPFYTEEDE